MFFYDRAEYNELRKLEWLPKFLCQDFRLNLSFDYGLRKERSVLRSGRRFSSLRSPVGERSEDMFFVRTQSKRAMTSESPLCIVQKTFIKLLPLLGKIFSSN